MPLYLSKKRVGANARNTQQGDSSYERNAPSGFRYIMFARPRLSATLLFHYLAASALAIMYSVKFSIACGFVKEISDTAFIGRKKEDMLPIRNPNIALAFPRGRIFSATEQALLEKYSARVPTPVFRGSRQYHFHMLSFIEDADLPAVMALKNTNDVTAPADCLSNRSILAYLDILSIVSTVVFTLRHGLITDGANQGHSTVNFKRQNTGTSYTVKDFDLLDPEDMTLEKADSTQEEGVAVGGRMDYVKEPFVTIGAPADGMDVHAWGNVNLFNRNAGLSVPFRKDYSTPDVAIFYRFASAFPALFAKDTLDDSAPSTDVYLAFLGEWWRREIHNTLQGEWLAHLMMTCVIAKEAGCSVYGCVNDAGMYLGSILGGGHWKMMVGDEVMEPTDTAAGIQEELLPLDAHTAAMARIMDLLGVPEPRTPYRTMREMRTAAIGANPVGSIRASISELLPLIDFGVMPDGVNSTTLKSTIRALSNLAYDVPNECYLAPGDFWTEDRNRVILSRFGKRVPTFFTGQAKIKLSPNAHGPGVNKARPFSNQSPPLLQFGYTNSVTASQDWSTLMRTGMASIQEGSEIMGNHVAFRGAAAQAIWNDLVSYTSEAVGDSLGQGGNTLNPKRGREEGEVSDDESGYTVGRGKKARFTMF